MEIAEFKDTADLFRWVREENNLSQTQLAKRINANGSYLSNIESGKKVAGPSILKRLAEEFKIDLEKCMALREVEAIEEIEKPEKKSTTKTGSKKLSGDENVINLEDRKNKPREKVEIDFSKIKTAADLFLTVRKANGYTISKMVKEMNSSSSYLSQIENGKKLPGKKMVLKLAEAFNLPEEKCLQVAGFSKESNTRPLKNNEVKNEEIKKEQSASKKSKEPKVKVNVTVSSEQTNEKAATAIIKEMYLEDEAKDVNSLSEASNSIIEPQEKPDVVMEVKSANEEVMEKLNYSIIARSKGHLVSGKKYVTDLSDILENVRSRSYQYEMLLSIDGDEKKSVALTIANNELIVSLETQAN